MKKWKWLVATSASAVALAACSGDDTNEESEGANEGGEESAEEILTQSIETMEGLNSYSVETNATQTMDVEGEEQQMEESMSMDLMQDPLSFAQSGTGPDPMTGEQGETQEFFKDGTVYSQLNGEWIKADGAEVGLESEEDLPRPAEGQADMLLDHIESFSVEDDGDRYALTAEGSGEDLQALAYILAGMQPPQEDEEAENGEGEEEQQQQPPQPELALNQLDLVLYIDKETYQQEEMDMNMDVDLVQGEQTMATTQSLQTTYSQFDEVEEIEVPEEALDNAITMEEMQQQMQEEQAPESGEDEQSPETEEDQAPESEEEENPEAEEEE
ncbi:DUF6612 family protein [Shouchella shacheensis]|uniref:DUF6612 family protein n=1 Tax=Shouchella shacheensis TaxID=1649580 RepID=UPI0007402CAE|nr:DUF6612 family protein [Shouchella shacheensis]